jgi:small-conductance mechanosensitive channel
MINSDFLFSIKDQILVLIAFFVIAARLVGFYLVKKTQQEQYLSLKLFLNKQPWGTGFIIVLSALASYALLNFSFFNLTFHSAIILSNAQDSIRSILSLMLLILEVKALYLALNNLTYKKPVIQALLPYLKHSLYFMGMALTLPFIIPNFLKTPLLDYITHKMTLVLVIWTGAWFILQIIIGLEKITLQHYHDDLGKNFHARRAYTQARLLKRMAIGFVLVLATALSAMIFEHVRAIGTSILASAGLATAILGFAAQKTLSNLFSGIQIAMTQPISINDTLVIDGELGVVEEISLTYVVIRIWDLRRLVLPINYFLEKPFQNLTRTSTNLLCPVFFMADYTLPIEKVREKFMSILEVSPFWDKKVSVLQVVEASDKAIQIRALASAADSPMAWNLKCEILEKLIGYIAEHYPESLPKARSLQYQAPSLTERNKLLPNS